MYAEKVADKTGIWWVRPVILAWKKGGSVREYYTDTE